MKRFFSIRALLILGILTARCSHQEKANSTKTIGVTLLMRAHVFYKDLEEGLKAEALGTFTEMQIIAAVNGEGVRDKALQNPA